MKRIASVIGVIALLLGPGLASATNGFLSENSRQEKNLGQAEIHREIATLNAELQRVCDDYCFEHAADFVVAQKNAKTVFQEFGVAPGEGLNLNVASAPAEGRSYITYVFKDSEGKVVYVGRASGPGTPNEVLKGRLAKGHEHFKDGLKPEIVDVQGSKLASQGAEEVFIQGYREQGATLTNVDEALSFSSKERAQRSIEKIEAYKEDLAGRKKP